MLVQNIMTQKVIAIDPDLPIADVHKLMEQHNIRHFPIVENNKLVGIVSDRDTGSVGAEISDKENIKLTDPVRSIMVSSVITAHPLEPIEEAAKLLRERKIGAMPVVEDGQLVGIVTAIDFLEALVKMSGVYEAATRLEIELENRPSVLADLASVVAERNLSIESLLPIRVKGDTRCFVIRVNTIDGHGLANVLRQQGFHVTWPIEKETL